MHYYFLSAILSDFTLNYTEGQIYAILVVRLCDLVAPLLFHFRILAGI